MYILAALFLDALLGDPKGIPHPVSGVGAVARFWESRFYPQPDKARGGRLFCAAVVGTTVIALGLILWCASFFGLYPLVALYLLYAALAWRSLKDETWSVAQALFGGHQDTARGHLSLLVGRDTENLDETGVVRATIETVGEGFVDGVFSVLFFMTLGYIGGLGGAVLAAWFFKAVSTLDSMVGYDDQRYRDFGRASARLDDLLNFIPARLGGVIALAAGACAGYPLGQGWRVFSRDRRKHKSPNSAHGESAFAGLLGVRLGGGASYNGVFEERPEIGDKDFREPEPLDILRSHKILDASVAAAALIVFFVLA
jgi:adenosylcobinamide-phosphate synthase